MCFKDFCLAWRVQEQTILSCQGVVLEVMMITSAVISVFKIASIRSQINLDSRPNLSFATSNFPTSTTNLFT